MMPIRSLFGIYKPELFGTYKPDRHRNFQLSIFNFQLMYKTYLLVVCLLTVVLLFASCTRANLYTDDPDASRVPVELSPQIGGEMTRVGGNEWNLGDMLGVFMLRSGASLQPGQILDEADNRCYLTASAGAEVSLYPADDNQVMYYPVDGSIVDFVAYYPYRATGTGMEQLNNYVYPVRVDDQSDFSAIDLLYSTGSGSKHNKTVVLNFAHQLSKIRMVVRKATELASADLSGIRVVLGRMPLASGFNLADAAFNYRNPSGSEETGDITARAITGGALYEALVLPQPANAYPDRSVSFVLPENSHTVLPYSYRWTIPDGTVFRSGKEYTYNFTLRAGGVDFAGLTISDWDDYSFEATALEMVSVPGGTLNGDTPVDGFVIGRFPVTNSQYAAFLNTVQVPPGGVLPADALPPDEVAPGAVLLSATCSKLTCSTTVTDGVSTYRWRPAQGYEDHPVTGVSWYGARAFATWHGGSLPTASQWEYACRGQSAPGKDGDTAYCFGNEVERLSKYAWYEANNNTGAGNGIGTKEVGTRLMNAFSLYDMHGNVWEWCADWHVPDTERVLRGGAYDSPAEACRSDYRYGAAPESMEKNRGFRIMKKQ